MEAEVEPGKKVRIKTRNEEINGIILESPSDKPEIVLVKLNSGYNIGLKKENILNIEILKTQKKKEKIKQVKFSKKLPYIDLIVTGGTISSKLDPETGAVSWLTEVDKLLEFYPELREIVNIRKIKTPFMKASENMDYKDWQVIAKEVEESLNSEAQGVIITHGTDFLHYTSAALSFFLGKLNKPVVLTYSQRSSDRASSDARLNLVCAAKAAISDIAEVMLVGHASINDDFCYAFPGTKVRKLHTSKRDAFKVVNDKAFAKILKENNEIKLEVLRKYNKRNELKKIKSDLAFNEKIALVKFYPGMKTEDIDYYSTRYSGIVIEASGLGHVAIDEARNNLLPSLKKAINNGLVVCIVSQAIFGRVNPRVYSLGRKLEKIGAIFLEDMLAETALVKLGWVLGHPTWRSVAKVKEKMLENFSNELNNRLES